MWARSVEDNASGRRTTGWAKRRRHETPSHDTVSPTTTQRAPGYGGPDDDAKSPRSRWARRHGEPDDDAKSPRLLWARQLREEPQVTAGPTTTRRARHRKHLDDAKSPTTW